MAEPASSTASAKFSTYGGRAHTRGGRRRKSRKGKKGGKSRGRRRSRRH